MVELRYGRVFMQTGKCNGGMNLLTLVNRLIDLHHFLPVWAVPTDHSWAA